MVTSENFKNVKMPKIKVKFIHIFLQMAKLFLEFSFMSFHTHMYKHSLFLVN